MKKLAPTNCPSLAQLETFAMGTLAEEPAEAIVAHLESCASCQQRLDDLTPQHDSLVAALKGAGGDSADDSKLQRMMHAAVNGETIAADDDRTREAPTFGDTVNLESFVDGMRRCGLLDETDVDQWLDELQPTDARKFAKALVKQDRLTRFQAQALLQGRHQHLLLGNYEILEPLGEGGMGRVFKARHRQLGRIVCLKVLHAADRKSPQLVERFRREAQTVAALSHPNIVVAHDANEEGGVPYLAMEYIDGADLSRYVVSHGKFAPVDAVQILLQAARALEYAHSQGVVHRDVKPSNLLLARDAKDSSGEAPLVKVLDLGLARFDSLLSDSPDALAHTSMTSTGVVMGTVDYMSPEQALNSRRADQRSDIYSLGCTFFYLLTGRVMYEGETVMEKLIAHRERAIPSLIDVGAQVPTSLDAVFQKMIAKDPDARYPTMSRVIDDLERFLRGDVPTAVQDSFEPMLKEPLPTFDAARRRQAIWMTFAAAAVLVFALSGVWMLASADWMKVFETAGDLREATLEPAPPTVAPVAETPKIEGHPDTLQNNGAGRVLLVVPNQWFYEDHFQQMTQTLEKRGVSYQVASSSVENARPKHGKIAPVAVQATLDKVKLQEFDAVFFLGGNVHEFTHKNPTCGEQAKGIITQCLDQGQAVAAIGNGWDAVKDSGQTKECQMAQEGSVRFGKPQDGRPGVLLQTSESKHAAALVDKTLDILKVERLATNR